MTQVMNHKVATPQVVAENVRAEAARRGYTQVALGRALFMSQGNITRRWKGVTAWKLEELDDVARILGVSVRDLVTPSRLPRLDSNQQPSGYVTPLVRSFRFATAA